MALAVYDMDLTLTRAPTFTPWLIFWAWQQAPWRLALLPVVAAAGLAYRTGLISRARLKEFALRRLMGNATPRAEVGRLATAFAATVRIMPGALVQLAADRAAGLEIVMATASFDFYARAIAARLGIASVVATRSKWDGDRLHASIEGENCYGAAKAAMIAQFTAETIAKAYSDHVSDVPLFAMAVDPVAVSPSRALLRLAKARGWQVVDWRSNEHGRA